jgi:hypothetical protein
VKAKLKPEAILKQIARIQRMERGKLCRMRAGLYYNHQTWEKGRNIVRYVPRDRADDLQKAISGYQQYVKLTKTYADEIIRRTRQEQAPNPSRPSAQKQPKPDKPGN